MNLGCLIIYRYSFSQRFWTMFTVHRIFCHLGEIFENDLKFYISLPNRFQSCYNEIIIVYLFHYVSCTCDTWHKLNNGHNCKIVLILMELLSRVIHNHSRKSTHYGGGSGPPRFRIWVRIVVNLLMCCENNFNFDFGPPHGSPNKEPWICQGSHSPQGVFHPCKRFG